jgi:hypothetical protein
LRYPIELGLLLGHLLLQLLLLFLSLLHLIANQSAADQTDGSANTGARSGMSGRAADDTTEASSGKRPDSGALVPGRQGLRTTEKKRAEKQDDRASAFHGAQLRKFDQRAGSTRVTIAGLLTFVIRVDT